MLRLAWLACAVYATVPAFWLMIHPFATTWRSRRRNPYFVLVPAWAAMWIASAAITRPWRTIRLYDAPLAWAPAAALFALGIWLYFQSSHDFSRTQIGGVPELLERPDQHLVTTGIRARVRHPLYLAHLVEMLAWSLGSGLTVCYALTAFAMVTGALMMRMEDNELEERFGAEYVKYRQGVPTIIPRVR
jgi:protein-S-isoprenylcysteine O-methyltransferase Ste14